MFGGEDSLFAFGLLSEFFMQASNFDHYDQQNSCLRRRYVLFYPLQEVWTVYTDPTSVNFIGDLLTFFNLV